jgi:hypothetical protein
MESDNKENLSVLEALLREAEVAADKDIKNEQAAAMSTEELALADIARKILRLERDMTMPGNASSKASRIERLSKFIEEENF